MKNIEKDKMSPNEKLQLYYQMYYDFKMYSDEYKRFERIFQPEIVIKNGKIYLDILSGLFKN